jgi:hypothetical protein
MIFFLRFDLNIILNDFLYKYGGSMCESYSDVFFSSLSKYSINEGTHNTVCSLTPMNTHAHSISMSTS